MQSFEIKLSSSEENYQYWQNYTYTDEFVWVHLMQKWICYVVLSTKQEYSILSNVQKRHANIWLRKLGFRSRCAESMDHVLWYWSRNLWFVQTGSMCHVCTWPVSGYFRAESYFNFKLIKWLWFFQKWGTWHLRLAQGQITGVVPFRA